MLLTGTNYYLSHHYSRLKGSNEKDLMEDLKAFESQLAMSSYTTGDPQVDLREIGSLPEKAFPFDPNTASAGEFKLLGISDVVIRNIVKYRQKGGKFYRREDLKKIYGMEDALYERLVPWIEINSKAEEQSTAVAESYRSQVVNLNLADSATIEKLPGIGPVLSGRIIKYRHVLGGFYDIGQLKEVYGISEELWLSLSSRLYADTTTLRKININTADENTLARHPYIGRYTARGIISYRTQVHTIKNINELYINGLLQEDVLEKLRKYLFV
jgi:DNA uptake protein ComE-like DNA-binding protein